MVFNLKNFFRIAAINYYLNFIKKKGFGLLIPKNVYNVQRAGPCILIDAIIERLLLRHGVLLKHIANRKEAT